MNVGYCHQYYNKLSSTTLELNIYFLYSVFYSRVRMVDSNLKYFRWDKNCSSSEFMYVEPYCCEVKKYFNKPVMFLFVLANRSLTHNIFWRWMDVLVPPICQSFFFFLITEIEGNTNYVSRLETLSTAPDMSSRHKKIFFKYYVFG